MPDVAVGDVVRATLEMHDADNNLIENVFYFQNSGPGTCLKTGLPDTVGLRIETIMGYLVPQLSADLHFDNISYYNMTTKQPLGEHAPLGLDQGDNITYEMLPSGVGALITADTGWSRSRPKKFLAGIHENHVDGNVITSSALLTCLANAAALWITSFYDTFNDTTWLPGTWHRITTEIGEFRAMIAAVVNDLVAYQRRRKTGVGQ
jgi:hypothetical protein